MGKFRNKILAGLLALALFGPFGPMPAPAPVNAAGVTGTGFAEETLTVSSSATGITATLCLERGRQTPALLEVLTNAIYFTLDSPTATPDSSDYAAPVGTVIAVEKANYLRMIRQSADSSVKVTCFRAGQLPTVTSYDKSGTGVTGSGSTTLGPAEVLNTTHQSIDSTAAAGNGTVAAIDGHTVASIHWSIPGTFDATTATFRVEVSYDDGTNYEVPYIVDLSNREQVQGAIALGTGDEVTLLVDVRGATDLRVAYARSSAGSDTATMTVTSNVSYGPGVAYDEMVPQQEDTTHVSADLGLPGLTLRDDTPVVTTTAGTGRYAMFMSDAFGGLYVRILGLDGAAYNPTIVESIDDTDTHATGTTVVVHQGLVAVPTDTAVAANDIGMPAMSLDRRALGDVDIAIDGTSVTGGAGSVAAGTPRVTLASDDPAVVDLASIQTAVELIDNAVSGAGFNITQLSGTTIAVGDGVVGAGTQRVIIATDDEINDDIDAMRISLAIIDAQVFGAGTEAGALRVTLPTDGTGIVGLGSVDNAVLDSIADGIAAEIPATADITIQIADTDASGGNGTVDAQTLRVTIASDTTGVLSIDDNSGTITVDGPVGTPVFVRLSDGSAAVDPPVLGTATYTETTTTGNLVASVRNDVLDALAGTDNEIGPVQANEIGAVYVAAPPIVEQAVVNLFDGSAEADIDTTNFGASDNTLTLAGNGNITGMCLIFTVGTVTAAEVEQVIFFDADPTLSLNTSAMTVAEAFTVVAQVRFLAADYVATTTAQINGMPNGVNNISIPFHSMTHVALYHEGATQLTNEDYDVHFWYEKFE